MSACTVRPVHPQILSFRSHHSVNIVVAIVKPIARFRLLVFLRACPCTWRSLNTGVHALLQACLTSFAKRACTCPPVTHCFHSSRDYVSSNLTILLSATKHTCTCPPVAGRFTFGREAHMYMPTGRRRFTFGFEAPVYMAAGGLLSGTKRPCTCPPAAGRLTFGFTYWWARREAASYWLYI